jgi:hypothetical protein
MAAELNENNQQQRLTRSSTYSQMTQTFLTTSNLNLNSSFHKLSELNTNNILIPIDAIEQAKPLAHFGTQLSLARSFKLKPLTATNNPNSRNQYYILSNRISSGKSTASQISQGKPQSRAVDAQQAHADNSIKAGFRPSLVLKSKSKFLKVSNKEQKPQMTKQPNGDPNNADNIVDLTNESFLSRKSFDPHLTSLRSSFNKLDLKVMETMNLTSNSIIENELHQNVTLTSQNHGQTPVFLRSKINPNDESFISTELDNMSENEFISLLKKYRETKDLAIFVQNGKIDNSKSEDTQGKQMVGKVKTYAFQIDPPPNVYQYNYLNTGDYIVPIESIVANLGQDMAKTAQQDFLSNFGRKESPLHQLQRLHRQKTEIRAKRKDQYPSFFIDYINNKFEVRNYNKFVSLLKKKELNKNKPKIIYAKINSKIESNSDS